MFVCCRAMHVWITQPVPSSTKRTGSVAATSLVWFPPPVPSQK